MKTIPCFRLPRFVSLGVIAIVLLLVTEIVYAACRTPRTKGFWQNADSSNSIVTQVNVEFTCIDVINYPTDGNDSVPPSYHVEMWSKCHPTDCYWGKIPAESLGFDYLFAEYNEAFVKRYVYLWASGNADDTLLKVFIFNDFVDPDQQDYITYEPFTKN